MIADALPGQPPRDKTGFSIPPLTSAWPGQGLGLSWGQERMLSGVSGWELAVASLPAGDSIGDSVTLLGPTTQIAEAQRLLSLEGMPIGPL